MRILGCRPPIPIVCAAISVWIAFSHLLNAASAMTFERRTVQLESEAVDAIVASGPITPDVHRKFAHFLSAEGLANASGLQVLLHSPGGNLFGGLALGETFREKNMAVSVAQIASEGGRWIVRSGHCMSACSYAFLGGVRRTLISDSKIGVHQFYVEEALTEPTTPKFSARNLSETQRITGLLTAYVQKMGANAQFVVIASQVDPTSPIYEFSKTELVKFGIITGETIIYEWRLEPLGDGMSMTAMAVEHHHRAHTKSFSFGVGCLKERPRHVLVVALSNRWQQVQANDDFTLRIDGLKLKDGMPTVFPIKATADTASLWGIVPREEFLSSAKDGRFDVEFRNGKRFLGGGLFELNSEDKRKLSLALKNCSTAR